MKSIPTFRPRTSLLAALALSLGLGATAFAAPQDGQPGPRPHGTAMHGMPFGPAINRLHDDLQLDARQEALWKDADTFAKSQHAAMGENFRKQHAEIKAMLDQPGTDLRAIVKRMDDQRAEGVKQRDAVRERWFAVYDSLTPEQKEKARVFFKNGMERMAQAGKRMHERDGRGPGPRQQRSAPQEQAPTPKN